MDGSSLFDAGRDALALSDAELIPRSSGRHDDAVGRVNTPADVARWMVREALGAVRGERAAEPLTILEPAAGSGVFVAALCDALVQRDGRGQRDVARALRQIWAIDNDAGVQDAAVRRLRVLTGRPPPAWFRTHYRIGDTLLDPALLPERPVDLVIGNPPWVGVRHARRLTAFADWRDRFGVTEDLYAYFIRLRLLRQLGTRTRPPGD